MASFQKQWVRCFSLSTSVMSRRINIQRPNVPSTPRRVLNAVTEPIFPPDLRPPTVRCLEERQKREEERKSELYDRYIEFRLKQAVNVFTKNKVVVICHALPMTSKDYLQVRTKLRAIGMTVSLIKNDIAIKATQNSKYEMLAPFFTSTNAYLVSEQEISLAEVVKVLKKITHLHLIGCLVEDRILSRDAVMAAAKLPPLDQLRGELLTVLKSHASKTHRLLGQHQQELSRCLDQLANPPSSSSASSPTSLTPESGEQS